MGDQEQDTPQQEDAGRNAVGNVTQAHVNGTENSGDEHGNKYEYQYFAGIVCTSFPGKRESGGYSQGGDQGGNGDGRKDKQYIRENSEAADVYQGYGNEQEGRNEIFQVEGFESAQQNAARPVERLGAVEPEIISEFVVFHIIYNRVTD